LKNKLPFLRTIAEKDIAKCLQVCQRRAHMIIPVRDRTRVVSLYQFYSALEHSCVPTIVPLNFTAHKDSKESFLATIAVHPIKAKSSVTTNLPGIHPYYHVEKRQTILKFTYRVSCDCSACKGVFDKNRAVRCLTCLGVSAELPKETADQQKQFLTLRAGELKQFHLKFNNNCKKNEKKEGEVRKDWKCQGCKQERNLDEMGLTEQRAEQQCINDGQTLTGGQVSSAEIKQIYTRALLSVGPQHWVAANCESKMVDGAVRGWVLRAPKDDSWNRGDGADDMDLEDIENSIEFLSKWALARGLHQHLFLPDMQLCARVFMKNFLFKQARQYLAIARQDPAAVAGQRLQNLLELEKEMNEMEKQRSEIAAKVGK